MRLLLLLVSAALIACSSTPTRATAKPQCDSALLKRLTSTVGRPTYETVDGEFSAGTAFPLSVATTTLLLTAHHVFGPDGGLARAIAFDELPSFAKRMSLRADSGAPIHATSAQAVLIPGARAFSEADYAHDIAAFVLEGQGTVVALEPAASAPAIDARVYLLAPVVDGTARCHPARVVSTDGPLVVAYDAPLTLIATSGAPIVDEKGRLLGINIGGGTSDDVTFSTANPVRDFLPLLRSALAAHRTAAPDNKK